ncbi:hypothetical protein [Streptomyces sp. NPDC057582]|uniref:hypothetical protein n=1 Tax=Streptomyces sp. NPDC057582 TaxID=3346174 RepID=UPI0036976436
MVDLERRRPIDVLPGREGEPLAVWLRDHPEIEIICRDRGGALRRGRPHRRPAGNADRRRLALVEEPRRSRREDRRHPSRLHPHGVRERPTGHAAAR